MNTFLKTFLLAAIFVIGGNAEIYSAEIAPRILKLTDGRTFENWSVIAETDFTVTIRHAKGGTKVMKNLLPPEVLSLHPIVEPPPTVWGASAPRADPLPEPAGLIKKANCQRSIETTDELFGRTRKWQIEVPATGRVLMIDRITQPLASKYKIDYAFTLGFAEVTAVISALEKARNWAGEVHKSNPPGFKKSLGLVNGEEWTFEWENDVVVASTPLNGYARLGEEDFDKILLLLQARDQMAIERSRENSEAEKFAGSLK